MRDLKSFLVGVWEYLLALAYWDISRCLEGLRREIDVRKWVAVSGLLGGAWMVVLLSARSFRLAYLTNYTALWLTASVVSARDVSHFIYYASLVLSSAIQWAVIGLLFRAILQKISK
jgi:hypothetical protein